jgi:hypothetical protein
MMIWTTTCRIVPVVFLLAVAAAGPAVAKDFLSVVANSPAVPLAPRNPGRNFVRLPTLEYMFEIYTYCSDSRSPASLSLNVADTRKSLQASQIASDGPTEISLKIPANQIAPLVVEDFCIVEVQEDSDAISESQTQITIPAALSAQASLLCAGDEDKAITYVSSTLDVSLVCDTQVNDKESGVE